jgi:hypothetical protein
MRAFLQCYGAGRMPEECRVVARELAARGAAAATVVALTEEQLELSGPGARGGAANAAMRSGDIAVGNPSFVKRCVALQGLPAQAAPDYPACLAHLLKRRMWTCTLGEAAALLAAGSSNAATPAAPAAPAAAFYVKPAQEIKAFSGEEASAEVLDDLLSRFPASFPVSCSEKVDIACEHRVYVARGRVLAACHCPHPGCERVPLDMAVVEGAVAALQASSEALGGFGIDFCVLKRAGGALETALMEVNDGAICGFYDGVSDRDYTAMVEARWDELLAGLGALPAAAAPHAAAAPSAATSIFEQPLVCELCGAGGADPACGGADAARFHVFRGTPGAAPGGPPGSTDVPTHVVNLDAPPEQRWAHILPQYAEAVRDLMAVTQREMQFKAEGFREAVAELAAALPARYDFARELAGVAALTGVDATTLMCGQLWLETGGMGCSSLIAEVDSGGRAAPFLIRTMDWQLAEVRALTQTRPYLPARRPARARLHTHLNHKSRRCRTLTITYTDAPRHLPGRLCAPRPRGLRRDDARRPHWHDHGCLSGLWREREPPHGRRHARRQGRAARGAAGAHARWRAPRPRARLVLRARHDGAVGVGAGVGVWAERGLWL